MHHILTNPVLPVCGDEVASAAQGTVGGKGELKLREKKGLVNFIGHTINVNTK